MSRLATTEPSKAARWPVSRILLTLALYLPLAVQAWRYFRESVYYGEMIHWSGDWAAWLMLCALAVSPVRALFHNRQTLWLLRRRRDLGIASFVYAATHTVVYVLKKTDIEVILGEALEWGMATGWLALILFLPLFVTSNDRSVRALRGSWKRLHRLVYPAAVLVMLHWYGTAFNPAAAYANAAVLAFLLIIRLVRKRERAYPL